MLTSYELINRQEVVWVLLSDFYQSHHSHTIVKANKCIYGMQSIILYCYSCGELQMAWLETYHKNCDKMFTSLSNKGQHLRTAVNLKRKPCQDSLIFIEFYRRINRMLIQFMDQRKRYIYNLHIYICVCCRWCVVRAYVCNVSVNIFEAAKFSF